jgi:hypothetical protein
MGSNAEAALKYGGKEWTRLVVLAVFMQITVYLDMAPHCMVNL